MPVSLHQRLNGKVVLVGIGNPLRGDDAVGPALVQALQGQVSAVCIDAGSAPESYLGKIIKEKPDTVLLIDAVHLNQPPGSHAVLTGEEILHSGLTTHDLSPRLFIEFLEKETKATILLLGIQPQTMEMGAELSEPVQKTLRDLTAQLKETLHA